MLLNHLKPFTSFYVDINVIISIKPIRSKRTIIIYSKYLIVMTIKLTTVKMDAK